MEPLAEIEEPARGYTAATPLQRLVAEFDRPLPPLLAGYVKGLAILLVMYAVLGFLFYLMFPIGWRKW